MDFILSFYEKIAEAIHKTKIPLIGPGLILCFVGLIFVQTGSKPLGFWLVIIGIFSTGVGFFCLAFAPSEQTLIHGKYVLRSKIRNAALIPAIFNLALWTYWYAFMVYAAFSLATKTLS